MATCRLMSVWIFSTYATLLTTLHATSDFGPQFVGCYRDGGHDDRSMGSMSFDRDSMTLDMCAASCKSLGTTFFGVQSAIECFCDDQYSKNGKSESCGQTCVGNSKQICGGGWALSVYRVCPSGHYGPDCSNVCSYCRNNVDNPTFDARCYRNGTCWDGYTPPDFKPADATNCRRTTELLIAMSVVAGVFFLLLAMAIVYLCRMRLRHKHLQQQKQKPQQLLPLRPQQPLPAASTKADGSVQYRSTSSYYEELNEPAYNDRVNSKSKSKYRPAAAECNASTAEAVYNPSDGYLHPCPTSEYVDKCKANSNVVAAAAVADASVANGIYNPSNNYAHLYNPSEKYMRLTAECVGENLDNEDVTTGLAGVQYE